MNCVIVMLAHFVFSCVLINLDRYFILNINHLSVSVGCNNNPAICLCCVHDIFNHINVVKISLCGLLRGIHKCTYGGNICEGMDAGVCSYMWRPELNLSYNSREAIPLCGGENQL